MTPKAEPESGRPRSLAHGILLCLPLRLSLLLAAVLLTAVLGACASSEKPRPVNVQYDLHDPDPTRRTQAIERVVRDGERRYVPELIDLLDDRDEAVRLVAGGALSQLTGRESDYRAFAPRAERLKEAEAWRTWYAQAGAASGTERGAP